MLSRQQYYSKFGALIQKCCAGTGLFPSLMACQGALESNNGNSSLAYVYKAHFGIKADKNWHGKQAVFRTREENTAGQSYFINAAFRAYDSEEQGFRDRIAFLKANPTYREHGVFAAKTPEEQAEALQRAGYATAHDYASILESMLKQCNIKSLDK